MKYKTKIKDKKDSFLSEILKKEAYTVNSISNPFHQFKKNSFYHFKKNNITAKEKSILKKAKFKLIEELYVYFGKIKLKKMSHKDIKICEANKSDKSKILVAEFLNFKHSRFFKDKNISEKNAFLIKKKWIENFFRGKRGDKMYLAKFKSQIIGFVLFLINKNKATIDLINIRKKFQDKKVAKLLIYELFKKNKKIKYLQAGTQNSNKKAKFFYRSLNLKMKEKFYNYHLHN